MLSYFAVHRDVFLREFCFFFGLVGGGGGGGIKYTKL